MKVTSPIGELPFTVRSVTLEGRHMVVEGDLGTCSAADHALSLRTR